MADGVSEISGNSAVPSAKRWNESCRLQDHLLVGVGAPDPRPYDWHRFLFTLRVVSVAALDPTQSSRRAMDDLGSWRTAGGHRLVDGGIRSRRSRRSFPISAGGASHACLPDLCRSGLDRSAVAGRADAFGFRGR